MADAEVIDMEEEEQQQHDDMSAAQTQQQLSPTTQALPKKPLSAYFMFANDVRSSVTAQLLAESNTDPTQPPSTKVDVAAVGKLIGKRWAELTEEQKRQYTDRHKADKEQYESEMQRLGLSTETERPAREVQPDLLLPTHKVKKVITMDGEIKSIGKEALVCATHVTQQFLVWMLQRVHQIAATGGRKNVRLVDLAVLLRREESLEWLQLAHLTWPPTEHIDENNNDDNDDAEPEPPTASTDDVKADDAAADSEMQTTEENKENASPNNTGAQKVKKLNTTLAQSRDLSTLLRASEAIVDMNGGGKKLQKKSLKVRQPKAAAVEVGDDDAAEQKLKRKAAAVDTKAAAKKTKAVKPAANPAVGSGKMTTFFGKGVNVHVPAINHDTVVDSAAIIEDNNSELDDDVVAFDD